MPDYQPELGQLAFGQPHKEFEVPEIMIAALRAIGEEYDRVYWNVKHKRCLGPFGNHGSRLNTPTFQVHSYSWGDDDQPFNFAWRDLRISWYKWLGRGTSANMEITPEMASQCLDECLAAVRKMDECVNEGSENEIYPFFIDLE
jgi:hypothetical protein